MPTFRPKYPKTLDSTPPVVEVGLVKRLGELFTIEYDLLLYDVTSTYFEGVGAPEICKRGYRCRLGT